MYKIVCVYLHLHAILFTAFIFLNLLIVFLYKNAYLKYIYQLKNQNFRNK